MIIALQVLLCPRCQSRRGTFVATDTDAGSLYERNQLCKTFAGRFKVLDEVDQLRDTALVKLLLP